MPMNNATKKKKTQNQTLPPKKPAAIPPNPYTINASTNPVFRLCIFSDPFVPLNSQPKSSFSGAVEITTSKRSFCQIFFFNFSS